MKDRKYLLAVAQSGVVAAVFVMLLCAITWAAGGSVQWWHGWVGCLGFCGLLNYSLSRKAGAWKWSAGMSAAVLGLVAGSAVLASYVLEVSADGPRKHLASTWALMEGWNPVRYPILRTQDLLLASRPELKELGVANQIFRPSTGHVLGAVLGKAAGRVEAGKGVNLILMGLAVLCLWVGFRAVGLSAPLSWAGALVGGVHPVGIHQMFLFMLDGQMAAFLAISVGLGMVWITDKRWQNFMPFVCALLLLSAAKVTGFWFAAWLSLVFCAGSVWRYFAGRPRLTVRYAVVLLPVVVAFGLGFSHAATRSVWPWKDAVVALPQVRAVMDGKYAFDPDGSGFIQIKEFQTMNRFEQLIVALLGPTINSPKTVQWKIPFSISKDEVRDIYRASQGLRLGAFGPWTGGAFLIVVTGLGSGAMVAIYRGCRRPEEAARGAGVRNRLMEMWKRGELGNPYIWQGGLALAASGLLWMPLWWARYYPQAWTILVFLAVALATSSLWIRHIGRVALVVLAGNTLFFAVVHAAGRWEVNQAMRLRVEVIEKLPQPVQVYWGGLDANRFQFVERGIETQTIQASEPRTAEEVLTWIPNRMWIRLPKEGIEPALIERLKAEDRKEKTTTLKIWNLVPMDWVMGKYDKNAGAVKSVPPNQIPLKKK